MNQQSGYYVPSNKIEPGGLAKLATYGLTGTFILSLAVGNTAYYSGEFRPIAIILLGIIMGFFIGYFISRGAESGKIRNQYLLTASGILLGVLAAYVSAVVYAAAASGYQTVAFAPGQMMPYFNDVNLKILVNIFLVPVLIIPTWRGFKFLEKRPFCENCNEWVEKKESIYPFPIIDDPNRKAMMKDILEKGGFEVLEQLKLSPSIMTNVNKYFTQLDVEYCSTCRQFYLLSMSNREITWVQNTKGQDMQVEKSYPIIEHLIMPSKVYKTVRGIDYTEKPMDVDAMIGEVSWTHRAKKTLRKMFID